MRISDWSSDVCSSDLAHHLVAAGDHATDHRVGPRGIEAALGQAQRARHHRVLIRREIAHCPSGDDGRCCPPEKILLPRMNTDKRESGKNLSKIGREAGWESGW